VAETPLNFRAMPESGKRLLGEISARFPRLCALLLGLLGATGFQPLGLWPVALLAMGGGAVLFANASNWRQAAWLGWLFGVAHFTLSNNWIATAFTHQSNMPAILGWAAVPLLSLYLAVYPALAAGLARAIVRRGPGVAFGLVFAGCWIISEWMRGWVFTGYAWNPFAMVFLGPFERPGIATLAPYMGTYALSGLAVAMGFVLVALLGQRRWIALTGLGIALVAAMFRPVAPTSDSDLRVTIAQPDITQDRLNKREFYEANFNRLAQLSTAHEPGERRIVLWPESGMVD